MIRIAICDDDDVICSKLEILVNQVCDSLNIEIEIDIFNAGKNFIQYLKNDNSYNLLFLDIELDEYNGIDVSKYIRNILSNESMQIVYVTGKSGYDRQLFVFRPFDFIEKPFGQKEVFRVINKYQRIYGCKNNIFHYKYGHDTFWIAINEILYFKASSRKVIIKQMAKEDEFYSSLEEVREKLKNCGFIFPHKSYFVNYKFIKSFHSDCIIITNGDEIPIAKGRRKDIAHLQLIFENGGFNDDI